MKQLLHPQEEEEEEEEEEETHQNQFNRLPDELLLLIFNKLLTLRSLCLCSLVSKRFASTIPLVHSVSFSVPPRRSNSWLNNIDSGSDSPNFSRKLFKFLLNDVVSRPLRFIRQIAGPKPLPSSLSAFYGDSFRSSVCFLGKFREIRDLQIELPSSSCQGPDGGEGEPLIKWRAKFGTKLESFAFFSSSSIHETNRSPAPIVEREEEDEEESEIVCSLLKHRVHMAFQCLKDALVRHRMLLFLIEQHPALRSLGISDSRKQGLLSVREERIMELRNWMSSSRETLRSELRSIEVPATARQWHLPVLELPASGYVMRRATLVVMGMDGCDGSDDDEMVVGPFDGDEEAYGEAVREMMVNHMSKMKILM